jgi:hypothetical protein
VGGTCTLLFQLLDERSECRQGLLLSWDNYLFLLVQEGKTAVIRLHAELYAGVLAKYRQGDLSFVPHVTLGSFAEDGDQCVQGFRRSGATEVGLPDSSRSATFGEGQ